MKRSPMPPRKAPMRRTPLRPVSRKRQAAKPAREAAVLAVARRDGHSCAAAHMGGCGGGVHGHELIGRFAWTAGIYEPENIVLLCNRHNVWVEDNPQEALCVGLRIPGYMRDHDDVFANNRALRQAVVAAWVFTDASVPNLYGVRPDLWASRYAWLD